MKRFTPALDAAGTVDCHQHIWPAALIEALRARSTPPRLDGWVLHLAGEPPTRIEPRHHEHPARRALDRADGLSLTLLAPSSPLGVEYLPPAEAEPLVRAWHSVTTDIDPDRQAVWATLALREPDVVTLADQLAHPQVCGLQVPATAMLEPSCLEELAPVLAVAERAGLPVMVHPGPAGPAAAAVPAWWPATVSYSAQLAAAWFAWLATGRQLLPSLRIVFVALAGLAPLHHERLSQRGGPLSRIDPLVFYETSSYGAQAIDAMTRVVGVDTLVSGSDRPYAERADSGLGRAFDHSCDVVNPRRLLNGDQR